MILPRILKLLYRRDEIIIIMINLPKTSFPPDRDMIHSNRSTRPLSSGGKKIRRRFLFLNSAFFTTAITGCYISLYNHKNLILFKGIIK